MRYVGILAVFFIALGFVVYEYPSSSVFVSSQSAVAPSSTEATADTPTSALAPSEALDVPVPHPVGYVEYRNMQYGFSFYHSPEEKVAEFKESGGAMTITLENPQSGHGMQVFVVPYAGASISEERFKTDVPSGVRTDMQNTVVGGVKATTFISRDAMLGDTREVWFIRGGYLYEVTTFKNATDWLVPVMQSWKFL